ncbi:MAG: hypothetical protein COA47_15545 [Robiginitomaculum sp.]|nr:MAG: hypothetical protein COA47_15545 [Robiginitomaculum sp.]
MNNIANRNEIFSVNGSSLVFVFLKNIYFFSSLYLLLSLRENGNKIYLIFLVLIPATLILFGGRALIITFFLLFFYYVESHFKKISSYKILFVSFLCLPLLLIGGFIRNSAKGTLDVSEQSDKITSLIGSDFIIELSYLKREFDFDYIVFSELLDKEPFKYLFDYFNGVTWLLPRSLYEDKAGILGSYLAEDLFGIKDYAISYSYVSTGLLHWLFLFPFIAIFIGCLLRFFENKLFTKTDSLIKKVLFLTTLPSLPYLLLDIPTFLQGIIYYVFSYVFCSVIYLIVCFKSGGFK